MAVCGAVSGFEARLSRQDGSTLWTSVNARAVYDTSGVLRYYEGTLEDITERKQVEEALRASEERTRLILETALDAVVTMDRSGVIIGWNPQAERTFGWTRQDAIGRSMAETIIPERFREAHLRGLHHYLATGEGAMLNKRIELLAHHHDGHEFPVELAITTLALGKPSPLAPSCATPRPRRGRRNPTARGSEDGSHRDVDPAASPTTSITSCRFSSASPSLPMVR